MATCLILGAGRIGSAMAVDLLADDAHDVLLADASDEALSRVAERSSADSLRTRCADLADPAAIRSLAADADIVLGALPSTLGLAALDAIIDAGRPYCDISFMADDALARHDRAQQADVTAIVDCGVAPGVSNILAARACQLLSTTHRIDIYVGGLPKIRRRPFEYKAGFSPDDVLEEYTRPARIKINGRTVTRDALSEIEHLDVPQLGTLEAFNTDGLRSLLTTLDVPDLSEKTLRYPGHAELMRALRDLGLMSTRPITVDGGALPPRRMLRALLEPHWRLDPHETDLTVLRVVATGRDADGSNIRHQWDLYDEADHDAGLTSMARTTAFPCTIIGRLLLDGAIATPGVHAPEHLARLPGVYDALIEQLRARNVNIDHRTVHDNDNTAAPAHSPPESSRARP